MIADHALAGHREPLSRSDVRAAWEARTVDQRKELLRRLEASTPVPSPVRLRPYRRFAAPGLPFPSVDERSYAYFATDFLNAELLVDLLTVSTGVYAGVVAHPELLVDLLLAIDHPAPAVRSGVVFTLKDRTLGREHFGTVQLRDRSDVLAAIVCRLEERDWQMVCAVAPILLNVLRLEPSWGPQVRPVAERLAASWSSDLSAQGALERLAAGCRDVAP